MQASDLVLYVDSRYASPYAMSVFVALHEKGLPFSLETINLEARANLLPPFASQSLTSRVPLLLHKGFSLCESSAITEYLEELFPEVPVYPGDIHQRAIARQIQAWLRSDLMPIRQERPTEVIFIGPSTTPLSESARASALRLFSAASALLAHGGDNLFDHWCIADVDLALMLNRLVLNGDSVPEHLALYAKRQWQRPSVQLWVNQKRNG